MFIEKKMRAASEIGARYAHTAEGQGIEKWETLYDHSRRVAEATAERLGYLKLLDLGFLTGALHDVGKASVEFQKYLVSGGFSHKGPDHSTAGARICAADYGRQGKMAAYAIAGHHAGLANGIGPRSRSSLVERLNPESRTIPNIFGWEDHIPALPEIEALEAGTGDVDQSGYRGFAEMARTRLLFSALVDADSIETEAYKAEASGNVRPDRGGTFGECHRSSVQAFMKAKSLASGSINDVRREILDHMLGKASMAPGLFTMTVPTGGGKTLASLSFAAEHAHIHGLRRIIHVIPYTSVVEQTAQVFEEVLGPGVVLEHHSGFEWDDATGDRDRLADEKMRRATENWDAPVVVTTSVQLFESFFGSSRSKCRKLHSLVGSVIVVDEAQSIPLYLLRPCMAALDDLARNWGATVILCTATQPALARREQALPFKARGLPRDGLDIGEDRELAPDPIALHKRMRRTDISRYDQAVRMDEIAARMGMVTSMLCIVNSRADAQELFMHMTGLEGIRHLSTTMCAAHRIQVLKEIREDLAAGRPCRVVSTSLIEAGVDVDFAEVWREGAGLDSIIQAAGRCNREGKADLGKVVIFEIADKKPARSMASAWGSARSVLRRFGEDPASPDAVRSYWRGVYSDSGYEGLDAGLLDGRSFPIIPAVSAGAKHAEWPFESVTDAFKMIEDNMSSVVVPWGDEGEAALARYLEAISPGKSEIRGLRRFLIQIPDKLLDELVKQGTALKMDRMGSSLCIFDKDAYHRDLGILLPART